MSLPNLHNLWNYGILDSQRILIINPSEILQGFISVKNLKHILLALIYEQENSQEKLKMSNKILFA